jgi:YidC/Oxa1 family membrane protein insertase
MLASRVLRPGARLLNTVLPRTRQVYHPTGIRVYIANKSLPQFSSISVGNNLSRRPQLPQLHAIHAVRSKSSWNPFLWGSSNTQPESIEAAVLPTPATPIETVELASTSSVQESPSSASNLFESLPSEDPVEVSNVYEKLSGLAVNNTEPYIGFLNDAGLNFGWGPTSMIQWMVEHIHVYTGLPWWGTVLVAAAAIRLALVYPSIVASDQQARFTTITPIMQQLQQELSEELKNNPQFKENPMLAQAKFQQQMSRVKQAVGLSMTKLFLPIAIQLPLGVGTFRLLTNLSTTPGIGITSEGLAWFKDLTLADPYYILPVIMSSSLYVFMWVSFEK